MSLNPKPRPRPRARTTRVTAKPRNIDNRCLPVVKTGFSEAMKDVMVQERDDSNISSSTAKLYVHAGGNHCCRGSGMMVAARDRRG